MIVVIFGVVWLTVGVVLGAIGGYLMFDRPVRAAITFLFSALANCLGMYLVISTVLGLGS